MTEEHRNPYESPSLESGEANGGQMRIKANRGVILLGGIILAFAATGLTFLLPTIAVPAALLLMPLALRTLEVSKVRRSNQIGMSGGDWMKLISISLLAAIPIGVASLLLFCCVCTPIGFAAATIKSQRYGPTPFGLAVAVFVGMIAALWLGYLILTRNGYLSKEVKDAHNRPA